MDEARLLFQGDAPEGTVIMADVQTRGRGRFSRSWESEKGNLLATLLWSSPKESLGWYAMLMGFAIQEVISTFIYQKVILKWPNDVLVGGRKISGVLTEYLKEKDDVHVVIGMGFGVNIVSKPENTRTPACALSDFVESVPSVSLCLSSILKTFEALEQDFLEKGPDLLKNRFFEQTPKGVRLKVSLGQKTFEGSFVSLSDEGHIILDLLNGERKTFASGDVIS